MNLSPVFFHLSLIFSYITDPHDWYFVTTQQISIHGGAGLLSRYKGSLIHALQAIYPHIDWKTYRFSRPHQIPKNKSFFSKNQHYLFQVIKQLFPHTVHFNYNFSANMVQSVKTKAKIVEFDVSLRESRRSLMRARYLFLI